jgi:hypothetical protein
MRRPTLLLALIPTLAAGCGDPVAPDPEPLRLQGTFALRSVNGVPVPATFEYLDGRCTARTIDFGTIRFTADSTWSVTFGQTWSCGEGQQVLRGIVTGTYDLAPDSTLTLHEGSRSYGYSDARLTADGGVSLRRLITARDLTDTLEFR